MFIRDGMIIDGTGNPGFDGAVGVEGEQVRTLRGDLAGIKAAPVIADLVLFDAQRVKASATRMQPKQFPIGIAYVIVNGKVVVDKGQHTGIIAGRVLRRGQAST